MPTDDQLAVIRSWVGSEVGGDDDSIDGPDLDSRFGRLGSSEAVALEILRMRRADMLRNPAVFDVAGDYSESRVQNLKDLDKQIDQLARLCGANNVTLSTISRNRPSR